MIFSSARVSDWWKPKAANLLAVVYAAMLITRLPAIRAFELLLPSVVTIFGIGSFGHFVNDYFDIEVDRKAGKPNSLVRLGPLQRGGLLFAALTLALLPWLFLPADAFSLALLLFEFSLLLAYAAPPVRLKQRVIWSIAADAGYAYSVPALLALHTFFLAAHKAESPALSWSLFPWQCAFGARHFLNHIALDRINDIAAGTSTLATRKSNRFIHSLIRHVFLPIEVSSFVVYLVLLARVVPAISVTIVAVFAVTSAFHAVLAIGRVYPLFTYRFSKTHLDWLYQDAFPLVLLILLSLSDWRFTVLFVAHIALFYRTGALAIAAPVWPIVWLIRSQLKSKASFDVSRSAQVSAGAVSKDKRSSVSIAVVNINKAKYTETFIHGAISRLNHTVHYLHGGELPIYDADNRHFLSSVSVLRSLAQFLENALPLEKNHFLSNSISNYLQAKQVRLVLAHFGPVGVEMLPITRDLGIPLVVLFHGYDVFHKETLRLYAARYQALFREAACLIGVSRAMLNRLGELGAPCSKLVHLPAFVNLDLFPYTDHSARPPRILAVGRFAETKSPHLTILAFHGVVQVIRTAQLVLVGKGGGGELFESCVILVQALGLQDRVSFKGVLSHLEVAEEMRMARIFVQHSVTTPENQDMEGKPVAVMEAMANGLPVVATSHSGIVELIEDGVTGILVPEFNIQLMTEALIRLCQDDDLVRRIGENASTAIHNHPLISRHVEILEEIVDRCLVDN